MADYSEQWTDYKRLRNIWLTFFLAELAFYFGPLDRLTWRTFRPVFPTVDPMYFFVGPLFAIGVLLIIAGDSLRKWKCPRCGKPFAGSLKAADQSICATVSRGGKKVVVICAGGSKAKAAAAEAKTATASSR